MNISQLPKLVRSPKKRLGRGYGSGRAKTAGRGTKGQKARGTMPTAFEGGQLQLIKRLPLLRGKGRNKSMRQKPRPIPLDRLNVLPKGSEVSVALLHKYGIIKGDDSRVKIVGTGKLSVALTILVPCSKSAKAAIEKSGGTVGTLKQK